MCTKFTSRTCCVGSKRDGSRRPRVGLQPSHVMQAFFPDSCKSRACRIASMPVASKLRRGAAALSSLLPLTGRFITSELRTDHTSVRRAVSASPGSSTPGGAARKRFTHLPRSRPFYSPVKVHPASRWQQASKQRMHRSL